MANAQASGRPVRYKSRHRNRPAGDHPRLRQPLPGGLNMGDTEQVSPDWFIFKGRRPFALPDPPPWRRFEGLVRAPKDPARGCIPEATPHDRLRGERYQVEAAEVEIVNAAILLRRPLLVT